MKHESVDKYVFNGELNLDLLIDNYTNYINKVINNMACYNLSSQDKEEILVDTFYILWKNYMNGNEIKVLDSYLAGIAKNLVRNQYKKNKSLVSFEEVESLEKYADYDVYNDDPRIDLLYKSINKLSEIDKNIINLYYYSSKSIKEISSILKMSETNIKIKLFRIRKKLNKEIRSELKYE